MHLPGSKDLHQVTFLSNDQVHIYNSGSTFCFSRSISLSSGYLSLLVVIRFALIAQEELFAYRGV